MISLVRIAGFDWDEGNTRKSADKHGISQTETEQVFFNTPLRIAEDVKHSETEPRFQALGKTHEERLLHVSFTIRGDGTLIRIISARPMSRRERALYDQET